MREEQALGLVDLTEPQRDLGLEQLDRLEHGSVDAGREPLARDLESQRELVDHLQRRDACARLEARDVGGGAAGERELPLRQARPLARRLEADAELARRVDVGGEGARHDAKSIASRQRCCLTSVTFGRRAGRMTHRPRGLSRQPQV